MKNIIYIILLTTILFLFNGCFAGGHINSSGQVGMNVGGKVF
ncbi:hypothetical protein [Aliarcobacter lanthieri]|nr:hypothetical protein [Aliarcobacter lanthieri]